MRRLSSLQPEDFVIAYEPQEASVGLPFLMAEVRDRAALRRVQVNLDGMEALIGQGVTPDAHLFTRADDGFDLRARMFAPLDGVPEDPATGSANCALAGMLALRHAHVDDKGAG
jgi:trans-2,3-dihydro-3-hydroxyanthranilate isomerase